MDVGGGNKCEVGLLSSSSPPHMDGSWVMTRNEVYKLSTSNRNYMLLRMIDSREYLLPVGQVCVI